MTTNQSLPLYRDGRHYDALNVDIVADIPFYIEEARRAAGPVLELACGTGRLTIPIAQAGVRIMGLDLMPSMLAHARTKAEAVGVEIEFVQGDCRSFDLGRKFALIFIAFNSMQHLHDYTALAGLFRSVGKHLAPGGKFIFDVFNPKIAILARSGGERMREREYPDPDGKGTITLEQTMLYDDASQVNRIQWYFTRTSENKGGSVVEKDFRVEDLHMRCFFPQELDLLVCSQGFEIEAKYGTFEHKPFASGDPKQVVVCKRRWQSVMLGTGVKWSEILLNRRGVRKQGWSITEMKKWRTEQAEAGRPSGLKDFCAAHGFCFDCRTSGVITTGYDEEDAEYLYSLCPTCAGIGRRTKEES